MNEGKFGDSYDIVKRSLIRWLSGLDEWAAHPMLTGGPENPSFLEEYSAFLGVRLPPAELLQVRFDSSRIMEWAEQCQDEHLFLDPDTGIMLPDGTATASHLKAADLVAIAKKRPGKLTLVFDQSIDRARDVREQVEEKLRFLLKADVHGITYESHVCFLLACTDQQVLVKAERKLTEKSRIPRHRLVRCWEI